MDSYEKQPEIIRENDIKSVTIVRMEVPCCGGLELAAKKALQASGHHWLRFGRITQDTCLDL